MFFCPMEGCGHAVHLKGNMFSHIKSKHRQSYDVLSAKYKNIYKSNRQSMPTKLENVFNDSS